MLHKTSTTEAATACLLKTEQISAIVNRDVDAHKGTSEQGLASYPCSGCPLANGKKGPNDLGVRHRLPYVQRLYKTPEVLLPLALFLPPCMHIYAHMHTALMQLAAVGKACQLRC